MSSWLRLLAAVPQLASAARLLHDEWTSRRDAGGAGARLDALEDFELRQAKLLGDLAGHVDALAGAAALLARRLVLLTWLVGLAVALALVALIVALSR